MRKTYRQISNSWFLRKREREREREHQFFTAMLSVYLQSFWCISCWTNYADRGCFSG